jgi:hypothetical protein
MDYLELTAQITPGDAGAFRVYVRSCAGEGEGQMKLPFGLADLAGVVHGVHPYVAPATGSGGAPAAAQPDAQPYATALKLGEELFDAMFNGKARTIFDATRSAALQKANTGVRIRITVALDDPDVCEAAALPWEMMKPSDGDPLSVSTQTPVVRAVDTSLPPNPPPLTGQLRILALKSNPQGTNKLDLDAETTEVEACWDKLSNVHYDVVAPNKTAILNALGEADYHVIHYMGHGGFDAVSDGGELLLEDEDGNLSPVPAETFAAWISDSPLRLVFLNACQSARTPERTEVPPFAGVATSLIHHGIPAVVGNQFSVRDDMAITFASTFYARVAQGHPIDEAVASARKMLFDQQMPLFWATPVLYMRSTDGYLFTRPDAAADPAAAAAPASTPQPEPVHAMSESNRTYNVTGNVSGTNVNFGDNSTINANTTIGNLPSPDSVDINAVLQQLKDLVDKIPDSTSKAIATNGLSTAEIVAKDPNADKSIAASGLTQAVSLLKSTNSVASEVAKLAPLVMQAAAWLGPHVAAPLLAML